MTAVLTAEQLRAIDEATVEQEGISSLELMERAAAACAAEMKRWFKDDVLSESIQLVILCGRGNNGGDGYVLARLFTDQGFPVKVIDFAIGEASSDNQTNRTAIEKAGIAPRTVRMTDDLPDIPKDAVVIDAIFGTGLNRPVEGQLAKLFGEINALPNTVWSVDVPSGVFASVTSSGTCVRAQRTFSLGYPKPAEFVPEAAAFYGEIHQVTFKLAGVSLLPGAPFAKLFTGEEALQHLKVRGKYDHKGTFGHALLVAGSHGKIGAAVLSARSVLRAGAGLLTCHVPACGYQIMQMSVPEAMCLTDEEENYISEIGSLNGYAAVGIGPGIGQDDVTAEALRDLLYRATRPLVLDADALNILSQHPDWWASVPENSILTPHPKEFDRLFGEHSSTLERWDTQRNQARKNRWVIVLKGGHSTVASPDNQLTINTTGNPGMATGGSGDVLTGILTGLLAQGYEPSTAARMGVCMHGLAGDNAVILDNVTGTTAGDIVENIRGAFLLISDRQDDLFDWQEE